MGENEQQNKSDHDLLIENTVLLNVLIKGHENHLKHHFVITCIALTAAATGVINLLIGTLFILASLKG